MGGGALGQYTGGVCPGSKKGVLRCGHIPKMGVLGAGTTPKKGVLGTCTVRKSGVLGPGGLRNLSCNMTGS